MFLYQTFNHKILSTSAKTFLFLVISSFFYNTLKFNKFPPSWFMAAHWRRLGIAVNDFILILNFSKKQKSKRLKDEYLKYCVECCHLLKWKAIRQCFCYKLRRYNLAWRHLRLFPVSLVTRPKTNMVVTLSKFKVI